MAEGFENLEVWKKGSRFAVDVYRVFRACKDFGFKDQVCRAAVSIPSNVAEGYERDSDGDFVRFLNIAKGSAGEARTQLYLAKELGLIGKGEFDELVGKAREISAMLAGLIRSRKEKRAESRGEGERAASRKR